MADSVGKKAKKNLRDLGQDSFETLKEQPKEVVKDAVEQVTGQESSPQEQVQGETNQERLAQIEQKEQARKRSRMAAHKEELKVISQRKRKEEEERRRMEAEKEAMEKRKEESEKSAGLPEPSSKPKRGLIRRGMNAAKKKVEQMKTRIETRFKSMG